MSRNRSGVVVQGAANKAQLNFKYEKLQLILIDEIRYMNNFFLQMSILSYYSMLGTNKNQTIHEVLTNLNHLDNHKPYGGLSMIFTGDLKQLGNVLFKKTI